MTSPRAPGGDKICFHQDPLSSPKKTIIVSVFHSYSNSFILCVTEVLVWTLERVHLRTYHLFVWTAKKEYCVIGRRHFVSVNECYQTHKICF